MQTSKNKCGFTLIEVLVAMTVLVLVVMAATNLLVSSIRGNVTNVNTFVAYGLAQEGLEAVRNIRDSDWLLGATFTGTVGRGKTPLWGAELPLAGETRYYTVELRQPSVLPARNSALNISSAAPWKLTLLQLKDIREGRKTRLYKKENRWLKETRYTHEISAQSTPFRRYVTVTPVPYPPCREQGIRCLKKFRVTSTVEWEEFGTRKQVRLDSELTNWKSS